MSISRPAATAAVVLLSLCGQAWGQATGPSSSQTPYVLPTQSGVETVSLLTVGDSAGGNDKYRMVGIPDGTGAYDNGDGTLTLVMNHELGSAVGVERDHGSIGAFVSKWIVNKETWEVVSGEDLVKTVYLWTNGEWSLQTTAFNRLCSADLPAVSAFYNPESGLGTQERIFTNGEEAGAEGRPFAHIVTGPEAGTSWELSAWAGRYSWENHVASPFAQDKTVLIGLDDSTGGQVYVYIGSKQADGTTIERAGLTNGALFGIAVEGVPVEDRENGIGGSSVAFSLHQFSEEDLASGAALETASVAAGVTKFLRPEDGHWDPTNPNRFIWCTTDQFDEVKAGGGDFDGDGVPNEIGRSRLWALEFNDITNPESGGTLTVWLDGTGQYQMLDNLTTDSRGNVLLQEDPGGQGWSAKIWHFNPNTGALVELAAHDAARFGDLDTPPTPPFTNNEESSGIIDASEILGDGWFLLDVQAHYGLEDPELVEGGQMLALYSPLSACIADIDGSGALDLFDFLGFTNLFNAQDPRADFTGDGAFDLFDFLAFVNLFNAGC